MATLSAQLSTQTGPSWKQCTDPRPWPLQKSQITHSQLRLQQWRGAKPASRVDPRCSKVQTWWLLSTSPT